MTHSRPYIGRNMVVFFSWDPERGEGGGALTLSVWADIK